jgi:hypothetical protein
VQYNRQRHDAAKREMSSPGDALELSGQLHVGKTLRQGREDNLCLESGEECADAVVDAVAKA